MILVIYERVLTCYIAKSFMKSLKNHTKTKSLDRLLK